MNKNEQFNALTPRQKEVTRLAAQGLTNKQIGKSLGITIHTVKLHIRCIFEKLHLNRKRKLKEFYLSLNTTETLPKVETSKIVSKIEL